MVDVKISSFADEEGKSDPFCKVSCNFSSQIYQTHTIYKTLEPVWNESFPIFAGTSSLLLDAFLTASGTIEPSHVVNLHLYDRDFVGQDFLGEVKISLSKLLESSGDAIEQWFTLEKEPTKTYNKEAKKPGQVQVKIHYPKVRLNDLLRTRVHE